MKKMAKVRNFLVRMLFKVKAEPVKPFSPQMFSKTDKVYTSAKHTVIRDMCVDPDELVFMLAQSLFLFLKKDFLNSPTKIFLKIAAKLSKTTAILCEKTPNPELRLLFRCNDWTRCIISVLFKRNLTTIH